MKLPKQNYLFLVERVQLKDDYAVPIASFTTEESASDYAGECLQKMLDVGVPEGSYEFVVTILSFYNV